MFQKTTRMALVAALALLGSDMTAGIVRIVNNSNSTWTLQRIKLLDGLSMASKTAWDELTIKPRTTASMDYTRENSFALYNLYDKATGSCLLKVSTEPHVSGGPAVPALTTPGLSCHLGGVIRLSNPSELTLDGAGLSEKDLWAVCDHALAGHSAGDSVAKEDATPLEERKEEKTATSPLDPSESKRTGPSGPSAEASSTSTECLTSSSTGSDLPEPVTPAPEEGDVLKKHKILLAAASTDLVETWSLETLARGPRSEPKAPGLRDLRRCKLLCARAWTNLNLCLAELEKAEDFMAHRGKGSPMQERKVVINNLIRQAKTRIAELEGIIIRTSI